MKKILLIMMSLGLLPAAAITDRDKALIVTRNEKPAQCLSAVVIGEIDGRETVTSSKGFELEPGTHTMNGHANINTTFCVVAGSNEGPAVPDLKAEFEAGKTYYIGLDHSSGNRDEWKLVIWKVEEREP